MNPDKNQPWQRLVAAARSVPDERDVSAPYGFAVRVAALAMASERSPRVSLFERFSLRALGVACLLALVAAGASYSAMTKAFFGDTAPAVAASSPDSSGSDDTVTEMVDLVS